MNEQHRCGCASDEWREMVRDVIIPWVLHDVALGDDVVELGPGFGATTDVLRRRFARLTAVEIDTELAASLADALAGTNVDVVEGDASSLAFDDDRFTGALSFSMLHHVHSTELQDRVFAEACRVLQPGGAFAATDSLENDAIRSFHEDDIFVPVDPDELPARLRRAGFAAVRVEKNDYAWKAIARKPD
jgi:SAM-dependent methyltransferase